MPGWLAGSRQLCQPGTEADREACHGGQPQSPRTAQRPAVRHADWHL